MKTGGGLIVELSGRRRTGEVFDLECSLSAWDAGDELQYGVILRDISQRKRQQERIRFLAEHDTLTGLPNRNSLIARIETAMQQPEWSRARTALITLSINRFQQLSDLHGHVFGDHLLLAVAARITELTDGSVMLARLGADEFAILAGTLLEDEADALAARVVTAFQDTPLVVDGRRQRAPLFAGLAMARDAADAEELLGNAHFALAESKSRDMTAPSRYQRRMRLALERRHALEAELREALRARPVRAVLPAAARSHDRRALGGGGAGALAPSPARLCFARRVHAGGEHHLSGRAGRELDHGDRLPAGGRLAAPGPCRARRREPDAGPVRRRQSRRRDRGPAGGDRAAAGLCWSSK